MGADDYEGLAPDQSTPSPSTPTVEASSASSSYEGLGPDTAMQQSNTPRPSIAPTPSDNSWFPNTADALNKTVSDYSKPAMLSPEMAAIRYSPVGLGSHALQIGTGALGDVTNLAEKGYKALAGPLAPNPQTALEAATNIEQIPETGLKDIASVAENGGLQGLASGTPSWSDIVQKAPLIDKLPDETKEELAKTLGLPMEVFLDPMWAVSPLGKTTAGEAAEKEALLEPNIAKAGQAGQRALLTVAGKPLIQGQPVLNAIGAGQAALRKHFPGLHTLTDDAAMNKMIERHYLAPKSNAGHLADELIGNPTNDIIQRNAEKMGIAPEELSQRMAAYRESGKIEPEAPEEVPSSPYHPSQERSIIDRSPIDLPEEARGRVNEKANQLLKSNAQPENESVLRGLQSSLDRQRLERESANPPKQPTIEDVGNELGAKPGLEQFPPEVQNLLRQQQTRSIEQALSEGKTPSISYLHHTGTPEFGKFLKSTFNDTEKGAGGSAPKSDAIQADLERTLQDNTVNDINNAALKGKLGDLAYPDSPYREVMNRYTGKVFGDDIAHIEANRYLQNAKVNTVGDFMKQAEHHYGIDNEAHGAGMSKGSIKDKEYSKVTSDHFNNGEGGTKWFPKQLADFMNGVQNPSQADMVQGWSKDWLKNASTAVKLVNFGLKPASAPFNYLSNLNLAYLNKGLSPKNVNKAFDIIAHERMRKFDSDFLLKKLPGKMSDNIISKAREMGEKHSNDVVLKLKDGTQLTEKQLMDLAHQHRGIGMGLEQSEMAKAGMPDLLRDNWASKKAMNVHMFAEDSSRLPVFMTYLEKGFSPEAAAKATREALYDYSNLGKTDSKIAQYVPFYRFARMNMPKMVEKMVTDPARTFAVEKAREAWNKQNGQNENERMLPDYVKGEEPWYAGKNEQDQPLWLQGGRYSTQNDINRPFGSADEFGDFHPGSGILRYLAGMANPALKLGPEEALNTNFSQGIPIARDLHANGGLGEMKNLAPGIDMPAKLQYAFNQLSPFSMARTAADQNVPMGYRLLHELGGVNMTAQDLDQANLSKDIGVKSDIQKLKNNVEYFGRKAAITDGKSAEQQKNDQTNFENALNEYQELSQKLIQTNENE